MGVWVYNRSRSHVGTWWMYLVSLSVAASTLWISYEHSVSERCAKRVSLSYLEMGLCILDSLYSPRLLQSHLERGLIMKHWASLGLDSHGWCSPLHVQTGLLPPHTLPLFPTVTHTHTLPALMASTDADTYERLQVFREICHVSFGLVRSRASVPGSGEWEPNGISARRPGFLLNHCRPAGQPQHRKICCVILGVVLFAPRRRGQGKSPTSRQISNCGAGRRKQI